MFSLLILYDVIWWREMSKTYLHSQSTGNLWNEWMGHFQPRLDNYPQLVTPQNAELLIVELSTWLNDDTPPPQE